MNVKVYQVSPQRDEKRTMFMDYANVVKDGPIDASIYDEVFNGELEDDDPESVFQKFNCETHPLYRGRSLSVSDVVVNKNGAYFCDTIGFKKIEFDEAKTQRPDNLLQVILVEPHKRPVLGELQNDLDHIQHAVGGMMECVYNEDGSIIVCNEEAKLVGMEGNRHYNDGNSVIAGPFFIVGDDMQGDFCSLTEEQIKTQMDRFAEPEEISREEVESDMGYKIFFGDFL